MPSKLVTTITTYIHQWNEYGLSATVDFRGGSIATFTEKMKEDVKRLVLKANPRAYGFEAANWTTPLLQRYIKDTYKKEYSREWIRQVLLSLGFTYKRGIYKPSKANPEQQKVFKKNVSSSG